MPALDAILADSINMEERGKGYAFSDSIAAIPSIIAPIIIGIIADRLKRLSRSTHSPDGGEVVGSRINLVEEGEGCDLPHAGSMGVNIPIPSAIFISSGHITSSGREIQEKN